MLRRILGPKRKWQEAVENYMMRIFIICTLPYMFRVIKKRRKR
jgi:hypothetical protein